MGCQSSSLVDVPSDSDIIFSYRRHVHERSQSIANVVRTLNTSSWFTVADPGRVQVLVGIQHCVRGMDLWRKFSRYHDVGDEATWLHMLLLDSLGAAATRNDVWISGEGLRRLHALVLHVEDVGGAGGAGVVVVGFIMRMLDTLLKHASDSNRHTLDNSQEFMSLLHLSLPMWFKHYARVQDAWYSETWQCVTTLTSTAFHKLQDAYRHAPATGDRRDIRFVEDLVEMHAKNLPSRGCECFASLVKMLWYDMTHWGWTIDAQVVRVGFAIHDYLLRHGPPVCAMMNTWTPVVREYLHGEAASSIGVEESVVCSTGAVLELFFREGLRVMLEDDQGGVAEYMATRVSQVRELWMSAPAVVPPPKSEKWLALAARFVFSERVLEGLVEEAVSGTNAAPHVNWLLCGLAPLIPDHFARNIHICRKPMNLPSSTREALLKLPVATDVHCV
jgi:hypothetical protein